MYIINIKQMTINKCIQNGACSLANKPVTNWRLFCFMKDKTLCWLWISFPCAVNIEYTDSLWLIPWNWFSGLILWSWIRLTLYGTDSLTLVLIDSLCLNSSWFNRIHSVGRILINSLLFILCDWFDGIESHWFLFDWFYGIFSYWVYGIDSL